MGQSLDAFDRTILRELQRDASLSVEDLASRVSLSRNACWRRVKLLEEAGVITRRVALVDPASVNAGLTVVIIIKSNQHSADWTKRFRDAISTIPEIVGAYRTAGDVDYILRARLPDVAAYDALYKKLIARVDMVDVSASFVMEHLKETTEIPLDYV